MRGLESADAEIWNFLLPRELLLRLVRGGATSPSSPAGSVAELPVELDEAVLYRDELAWRSPGRCACESEREEEEAVESVGEIASSRSSASSGTARGVAGCCT